MAVLRLLRWSVVLLLLPKSATPRSEADIEVYKAVREHERELNKATATFEHSMLAPLTLLNGGAVVALTTVLGAASLDLDVRAVLASIGLWSAGLFAVVLATYSGYRVQQSFAKAERGRRQEVESAIGASREVMRAAYAGAVDVKGTQRKARCWQRCFIVLIALSAVSFLAGAMIALWALLPAEAVGHEPGRPAPTAAAEVGASGQAVWGSATALELTT